MAYPEHIIRRAIELKKGRSAGAVLRQLEKEFPEEVASLNTTTILRWVKTKPEVLIESLVDVEKEQGDIPPSFHDNWKEHNEKLAGVANRLLANDLNRVTKWISSTGQVEYHLFDDEEILHRLTEDDLAGQFEQNIILVFHEYTEWFYMNCFLPHLYAEWPEELKKKGLFIVAEEQPYQLIDTLRLLAEKKTFKGTCQVCKDWQ